MIKVRALLRRKGFSYAFREGIVLVIRENKNERGMTTGKKVELYLNFGMMTLLMCLYFGIGKKVIDSVMKLEGDFWFIFVSISSHVGSLLMCVLLWPFYSVYILKGLVNAIEDLD